MISITPYQAQSMPEDLRDKSVEVYKRSARLEASVRPGLKRAVVHLLRFVNSYYSNKIEGNKTKPSDVVKAQHCDVGERDPALRDDLNEILAHILAQKELLSGAPTAEEVSGFEFISHIHELFFKDLSEEARTVTKKSSGEQFIVEPGERRQHLVTVGQHMPPDVNELGGFLGWFHDVYRLDRIHGDSRLLAAAASHHRLLWIHPFLDGNGRVTRLFTDVYMQLAGVEGYGLWSISRGFSRSVDEYKLALAQADKPRQGNTDGRGVLSDGGLVYFQNYFLDTCIEQIDYLSNLLELSEFDKRLQFYVEMRVKGIAVDVEGRSLPKWRPEVYRLLNAVINGTEVKRTDVSSITGLGETVSRDMVKQLVDEQWLGGEPKMPLRFKIPFEAISVLFPQLW